MECWPSTEGAAVSEDGPVIPTWAIYLGIGLAVAVGALLLYWQVRHPGETPFAVLRAEARRDIPSTNGHVPSQTASVGADADLGQEEGEAE